MRPQIVRQALLSCIAARQPVMLHGSFGVGKSDMIRGIAKELELDLIDLRLSQLDSADLRGIPHADGKFTNWLTPKFLPQDPESRGILFLDEINSAAQATQAAAYQLVLDRRLGDYELPAGWTIVAAGNRMRDRAIVNQMSTALKNRFVHLDYEVHFDDWIEWAQKNGIDETIIGFLRFRPALLNEPDSPDCNLKDRNSFATPRSWEFFSRLLATKPDAEMRRVLAGSAIGEGNAAEYITYCEVYKDLPTYEEIQKNPAEAKLPKTAAANFAVVTMLGRRCTNDDWKPVFEYIERLTPEYQMLFIKDTNTRVLSMVRSKEFREWAKKNADLLL